MSLRLQPPRHLVKRPRHPRDPDIHPPRHLRILTSGHPDIYFHHPHTCTSSHPATQTLCLNTHTPVHPDIRPPSHPAPFLFSFFTVFATLPSVTRPAPSNCLRPDVSFFLVGLFFWLISPEKSNSSHFFWSLATSNNRESQDTKYHSSQYLYRQYIKMQKR
ncbi:uncharacterized protein LALA0_S14e00496g [Lachancea lanzarotensis]|uniref:LALA0S14e00496g1_1 n=1 Tax=Lachancea lanzarotensis TaxID=1245769 RepID=A0A0C7MXV5_9SACH|nr:uncharacterized protein LALA0_S14e00496g [Lachancea lanzarotensis]CEP64841.1 LALA0S14e00496g1_1 [Lachancea lanzarotensis]